MLCHRRVLDAMMLDVAEAVTEISREARIERVRSRTSPHLLSRLESNLHAVGGSRGQLSPTPRG